MHGDAVERPLLGGPVVCTIVSNNYLAFARVFTRSFREHHPDGRVFALIVDRPDPGIDYESEPFTTLFAESIGISRFPNFAFRYTILELNTAVKPYLLAELARRTGAPALCYFDPDILVTAPLGEIWDLLATHDAVLTPHLTGPLDDGKRPSDRDILLSGIYNLGFLGLAVNPDTERLLGWWQQRLHQECAHRVEQGLFVDQRWMDFAPAFLPRVAVLRDPGFNVAYWNLAQRAVRNDPAGWQAGGAPLRFFHFSGFDPERAVEVSKHQDRFRLSDLPGAAPLFERYRLLLLAAGHEGLRGKPYAFGAFDNGARIAPILRLVLQQMDPEGIRWPDPFRTAEEDSYWSWLTEPIEVATDVSLPRAALCLRDHRPDLLAAFPGYGRRDLLRFASWYVSQGAREAGLDARLVEPVAGVLERAGLAPHAFPGAAVDLGPLPELSLDEGWETDRRPAIPALALAVRERRPDLRHAFPDPRGDSRHAFALWFATYGRWEYALPATMMRPLLRTLSPRARLHVWLWWANRRRLARAAKDEDVTAIIEESTGDAGGAAWRAAGASRASRSAAGVNIVGWPAAPTGVGQACRATLAALEAAAIPFALWPLADPNGGRPPRSPAPGLPFASTLFHVNADMMATARRQVKDSHVAGGSRVGYWFWELAYFPLHFATSFSNLDEVWAPSRFCLQAFSAIAPRPIRWVPPCVLAPTAAAIPRAALGVPEDAFLFFHCFDMRSVPERKNPQGLLAAFRRLASGAPRPVHLLLKVNHPDEGGDALAEMRETARGLPCTLLARTATRAELDGMLAACDAYVSLHRSEGLGLPLIEAMYLGKPVIATAYGGCTDFLDEETGWPLPYRLVPLERYHGPYPPGAVWADPDPDLAAEAMAAVIADAGSAARRAETARSRVERLYAPPAAGERLRAELSRLGALA